MILYYGRKENAVWVHCTDMFNKMTTIYFQQHNYGTGGILVVRQSRVDVSILALSNPYIQVSLGKMLNLILLQVDQSLPLQLCCNLSFYISHSLHHF